MKAMTTKMICVKCEKVYTGGPRSYFCPDCRREARSAAAKKRGSNKAGNKAHSDLRREKHNG